MIEDTRDIHMSEKLPRHTKICYGIGDASFSLNLTIVGLFFAIFLTDVVGLSPGMAAAAILIGRSWYFINDPLIGHLSDRTRTRWGRRRPFLLFGALPFGLAFMLMWWHPPLSNNLALAVYYALTYLLFDIATTFTFMPYLALTPELTDDYDERTALTSYRNLFSILASLVAFSVPLMIIGSFTQDNLGRVFLMGATIGLASTIPLLLVFLGTRERQDHQNIKLPGLRQSLRAALKNRPFVFGAAIFLFTWFALDIMQTALLFFIKYALEREHLGNLIMVTILVTAVLTLPLWQIAAKRWDKRLAYIGGIAFWVVVQLLIVTLKPDSNLVWSLILCSLAGVGVGAAHVLTWSIIPDAVEWDEWQTGERHEGMFYSLITLLKKVSSSIAIPLVLLVLELTNYQSNAVAQPASALMGIRIAIGIIPVLMLLIGIMFAFNYPLNRQRHAQLRLDLANRRASGNPQQDEPV
jgi:GPH family glycoside/pentoside/hexuronide:cation symporter